MMFPYDEYKMAIEAEAKIRREGVEAVVLNAEKDENQPGCYTLEVELRATCDEGALDEGTVKKDDSTIGTILSIDVEAGLVTVSGSQDTMPDAGDEIVLQPPDYLKKLGEFANVLVEQEDRRREERFMSLRDSLLQDTTGLEVESASFPYLREVQRMALEETEVRRFSFVWGPPGTGKSYTLGHIAAHYRAKGKRVLLLSTTNAAVDVATFAVDDACAQIQNPLGKGDLIRYSRVLTQKEEYAKSPHLMEFTRLLNIFAQKQRELDKKRMAAAKRLRAFSPDDDDYQEALLKFSAICQEIRLLADERKREIAKCLARARLVCSTVMSCLYNDMFGGNFDVILVDEASLIPLAVWPYLLNVAKGRKFVVAGDPMQLLPIQARDSGLTTHMWFDNSIYSHLGMTTFRGIEPFIACGAVTLLNEQTRMRKGICTLVSNLFYRGLLTGDRNDSDLELPEGTVPSQDVAFVDPADTGEPHGLGRLPMTYMRNTNTATAGWVLNAIGHLVQNNPSGRKLNILVVTPYRNQARRIYAARLKRFSENKDVAVTVSTVHRCQGFEADIVFFDLVNPSSWFVNKPEASHLWCVACSRARHKLVLVGDRHQMALGQTARIVLNQIDKQAGRCAA